MSGPSKAARGEPLDPASTRLLGELADVMIPGDERYPPASETNAVEFVVQQLSLDDAAALTALLRTAPAERGDLGGWLRQVEQEQSDCFALLRSYLYHGYYSSKRLLATLAQLGCEYRGAPQPKGFDIQEPPPQPATLRGGFLRTEEVRRVRA